MSLLNPRPLLPVLLIPDSVVEPFSYFGSLIRFHWQIILLWKYLCPARVSAEFMLLSVVHVVGT